MAISPNSSNISDMRVSAASTFSQIRALLETYESSFIPVLRNEEKHKSADVIQLIIRQMMILSMIELEIRMHEMTEGSNLIDAYLSVIDNTSTTLKNALKRSSNAAERFEAQD